MSEYPSKEIVIPVDSNKCINFEHHYENQYESLFAIASYYSILYLLTIEEIKEMINEEYKRAKEAGFTIQTIPKEANNIYVTAPVFHQYTIKKFQAVIDWKESLQEGNGYEYLYSIINKTAKRVINFVEMNQNAVVLESFLEYLRNRETEYLSDAQSKNMAAMLLFVCAIKKNKRVYLTPLLSNESNAKFCCWQCYQKGIWISTN